MPVDADGQPIEPEKYLSKSYLDKQQQQQGQQGQQQPPSAHEPPPPQQQPVASARAEGKAILKNTSTQPATTREGAAGAPAVDFDVSPEDEAPGMAAPGMAAPGMAAPSEHVADGGVPAASSIAEPAVRRPPTLGGPRLMSSADVVGAPSSTPSQLHGRFASAPVIEKDKPPLHLYGGVARKPTQPMHVLLQVMVGNKPPLMLRHPGSLPALRQRLSDLLALNEPSMVLSAELAAPEELVEPSSEQPRLMRVRVSGTPVVSNADVIFVLISWLNMIAAALFLIFSVYLRSAPSPFIYAIGLPFVLLFFHGRAAMVTLHAEFQTNAPLRKLFARRDSEVVQAILLSLLGPETVLLVSGLYWLRRGVRFSDATNLTLTTNACMLMPLILDLPLLIFNYLYHLRTDAPWDVPSMLAFGLGALSLLVHWPWRLSRAVRDCRRQSAALESDEALTLGEGFNVDWWQVTPAPPPFKGAREKSALRIRVVESAQRTIMVSQKEFEYAEERLESARERRAQREGNVDRRHPRLSAGGSYVLYDEEDEDAALLDEGEAGEEAEEEEYEEGEEEVQSQHEVESTQKPYQESRRSNSVSIGQ